MTDPLVIGGRAPGLSSIPSRDDSSLNERVQFLARWPGTWLVLVAAACAVLYFDALRTGFLGDDYVFLEQARSHSLLESLPSTGPLSDFFRPVSRQIYFEVLSAVGGRPWVFHAFNFALFLGSLALLADLLRVWLPLPGVIAGTVYFATLPLQRVNLTWVSCAQDLLALCLTLASVALFRRRREPWAALTYLLAVFSKESALPLPMALGVWALWLDRASLDATARRIAPFGIAAAAWAGLSWWAHGQRLGVPLDFGLGAWPASYVHGLQSLLGIEHPTGLLAGLMRPGPPSLALLFLLPLALLLRRPTDAPPLPRRAPLVFVVAWLLVFGAVVAPVVSRWSSYYYTLFAVGGAVAVGLLAARIGPAAWLALATGLVWWHGAATGVRAFAVADRPWVWTSHVTSFYLQRASALTDTLGRQLLRLEPHPEPGTRLFFSQLPSWAGFQIGNGAVVRALYRDPSIESYFYAQFSESTAADRPCRFLAFDGREFARLYGSDPRPFAQVGADLLAMDHLHGARHAFRRSLQAGEPAAASLYWLGWTELWLLRRKTAEAAWTRFGASDDATTWMLEMRKARQALNDDRDTLAARRALAAAIRSGIGRPEPHAVLGQLLLRDDPKYAILELKVAAYLKPDDWVTRRDLALGLYQSGLDDDARLQMAQLAVLGYDWRSDSLLAAAARTMERRSQSDASVIEF